MKVKTKKRNYKVDFSRIINLNYTGWFFLHWCPPISVPKRKPPSSQSRPFLVTGAVVGWLAVFFLVQKLGVLVKKKKHPVHYYTLYNFTFQTCSFPLTDWLPFYIIQFVEIRFSDCFWWTLWNHFIKLSLRVRKLGCKDMRKERVSWFSSLWYVCSSLFHYMTLVATLFWYFFSLLFRGFAL